MRLNKLKRNGGYAESLKGSKVNQERRAIEIYQIKEAAKVEVPSLIRENLWLAGLMLYWAEGNKSGFVGITNSDPKLIKLMMVWFRKVCCISDSKFRTQLHLHSGQNENQIKKFWSKITGIPINQSHKSYIKKEGSGHRKNKLYNGTIRVSVSDSNLLHRIQGWTDAIEFNLPA